MVAIRNITDRKLMEKALRESEDRFRSLCCHAPVGIFLTDDEMRTIYINEELQAISGLSDAESKGLDWSRVIHPEDRQALFAKASPEARRDKELLYELRIITPQNELKWISVRTAPISFDTGVQIGRVGTVEDITERKRASAALKESEALYRTLVETSPYAIVLMDPKGNVFMVNQQGLSLFGINNIEEVIGRSCLDFIIPEERNRAAENIQKLFESKVVREGTEYTFLRTDGTRFLGETISALILDAEGNPKSFITVIRDITEKKQMEEYMQKAEKLESIGVLAGGLAHDFNNILTAILGNISLARLFAKPEAKIIKSLAEAERSCIRARDLTQQLLTFSKGGTPIRKAAFISDLLRDTADFTVSGSNVACEYHFVDDLWPVEIDEGQMSQVINNLVLNAIQAMPRGGKIKISAQNVVIGEDAGLPLMEGNYVKISIEDQGIGIPEKHLPRIFDPYFTTKHKGSGLGLAITYSIIRKHEGHIKVESMPGVGTTFYVYLPASSKEVESSGKEIAEDFRGEGKILLMDDEDIIRTAAGEIMSHLGYEVETVKDGAEMIEIYKREKEKGKPFDAVIMDLTVVGGMGGREAIKELLKIDPDAKAIVSSGYSDDPVMAGYRDYGFRGVIAKPYEIRKLREVLQSVINE